MLSKEVVTQTRSDFWITFGKYMNPVPSSLGLKTNWINYKTGIKDLYIKMNADGKTVRIGIELTHKDEGLRNLFFEQLQEFKLLLEDAMKEEWVWDQKLHNESGKAISRVSIEIDGNIFVKDKWGKMFTFLKYRLIAFDEFWSDAQDVFKALES